VSSRPDVAPPSYTAELEKLQDQIPPFPSADAMAVLAAELGAPASVHFAELSPEPVAAASLGQARPWVLRSQRRQWGAGVWLLHTARHAARARALGACARPARAPVFVRQ